MHSDLRRTGNFECSDPLLNQLHRNVVWGLKGNFLDVPTDCPQRDERLGWTGDIAVFAPSAAFLYDVERLPARLARRPRRSSRRPPTGSVPFVVPDVLKYCRPAAGVPGTGNHCHLERRGRVGAVGAVAGLRRPTPCLKDQYDSMAAHARRVETLLSPSGLWDDGFQFGDWLDPDAAAGPARATAKADTGVVATACLLPDGVHRRARRLRCWDTTDDADAFGAPGRTGRERPSTTTTSADDGTVHSDCTTVYTLAIVFDLLDERQRARGRRPARRAGTEQRLPRLAPGSPGTPFITDALAGPVT